MCFRGCGGSARELIYPGDRCLRTKNVCFGERILFGGRVTGEDLLMEEKYKILPVR